jgi:hypothetical protein
LQKSGALPPLDLRRSPDLVAAARDTVQLHLPPERRSSHPHDVPNLFICDGSVFPSGTAVNPSLTIEAIAARTADRITDMIRRREL